ncbi:amino acid ABC transporter permease [Ancylobacter sp. Lp-2]|uniref:amino acid ABC transporter permease n=1 Tax=Ancylobacter sp. Lp-2 TaxID=2881339 RepID=UPI001E4DCA64|nr:amino acid ABC transporter permease [Ancylobacter sp. Lp-2]MCB4769664.1 amino acid ABC transporter permease [Ancylobacter sp. Lp-2]
MNISAALGFLWEYRQALLIGLGNTLYFTALGLLVGLVIGFVVSVVRTAGHPLLKLVATGYVEVFRGTPMLIQLFWFFFCLPALLGVELGNVFSTILTLSLYMGAISSESFRAALKAIGTEQRDACIALGLPGRVSVPYVILPQTVMRAVPTLLSNCVTLFKESALVSTVGMADLMYQGQMIADSTARPIEILTATALIYFIIAFATTRIVTFYEQGYLARMRL